MCSTKKAPRPPRPVRRVACTAFSGRVPQDRLAGGLAILESLGLELRVFMPGQPLEYLAGSDSERARCLLEAAAWAAESPDGLVMAIRGGYGAARALVDAGLCAPSTRLMGFSDVSALFGHLALSCGWECWHGPNVCTLPCLDGASLDSFRAFVDGRLSPVAPVEGLEVLAPGHAEGPLLVLNLTVLMSILGTPLAPPLDGVILAVEDTNEAPYRLERLFWQLLNHRDAMGLAGLVLGDLGSSLSQELRRLLASQGQLRGLPVLQGLPVGHGIENKPFQQLAKVRLDGPKKRLTLAGPRQE